MLQIQKNLSRSFYAIISLPSTAMGFALSVQISALSWILTTRYNLDIHEVGIVWAAGPLAGIFGQVIIGLISDKVWFWGGRRRPFILIGGVLAGSMLLALPNIDSIRSFFGIESLLGVAVFVALTLDLAINISFNPTRSVIADVTPEGNPRTKGYTWMQTISGFFGVLAYVIGAVFGNYVLIYIGVFMVLVFSILPVFFISEKRTLVEAETSESVGNGERVETATKWGQLFRVYIAHAFSWIGVQTMFVYIIAYVQQKLTADSHASAVFSGQVISISFAVLNTVGFILPVFILEPIAEKAGRVKTHLSCVAIMAIGYFLIAFFGRTPFAVYSFMAIVGVGWGAIVSLPFAIMSENVQKSRMGFFMGIFNLSVVLPQLFVSLGLGLLIQHASDKNIIFIISGVSVALSAFFWSFVKEERRNAAGLLFAQGAH
jgi:MFS family permease